MIILNIIGLVACALLAIFMHLLVKEMSKKYLLSWDKDPFGIISLYLIGVLPCFILVGIFIARIFNLLS